MATTTNADALMALKFLFFLEVDFQRLARSASVGPLQCAELHASFAIQHGYERRLAQARGVTASDLECLSRELTSAADPGDVLRAAGSLRRILQL